MREFHSDYADVVYVEKDRVILLTWKKEAHFDAYREPTSFALTLLQEHKTSDFIVDARNGFEDTKEDVEWGFTYLLPEMAKTGCKFVGFIMNEVNDIEDEMDMWSLEFSKYFTVKRGVNYEEVIQVIKNTTVIGAAGIEAADIEVAGTEAKMEYCHVDVFSSEAYAGNGLTVVCTKTELDAKEMQKIAQEFKQFETIFLQRKISATEADIRFRARIFTVTEELDFAGHPVIGAAATIHSLYYKQEERILVHLELNKKTVDIESVKNDGYYYATMNQGIAEFGGLVVGEDKKQILQGLNLTEEDLHPDYPMEKVSTGLPYVIVPLKSGLEKANIVVDDFEERLERVGVKFSYSFHVDTKEGRTWDNDGSVEDVATGSAAGPTGAYLVKHGVCNKEEVIEINQGRFVGRPSKIKVVIKEETDEVLVSGAVKMIARGEFCN